MKTKQLIAGIVLFIIPFAAISQSYTFKVLVNKGKNEIKSGSGWQTLKVGTSLKATDEIKVVSNGYLGLVHSSGKPIELKEPKPYKVADLARKIDPGANVVTKYTDFILSSNETKKNNLAATGAVHRGLDNIALHLPTTPEQSVVYSGTQVLTWDKNGTSGPFVVTFASLFGDELKVVTTSEDFITVDLDGKEFQNEDNVIVKVVSNSDKKKSDEFTLKQLSKADKARIQALLNAEVGAAESEQNALAKILLAAFYENNNLLIDAATCYRQAIQLAPDVPMYQEQFDEFLLRTGLKRLPKE